MNFDEKSKDWDKDPKKAERAALFALEIKKETGDRKIVKALEFGSGTGLVSFQLTDRIDNMVLADTSAGMLDVLKQKIEEESISNMYPFLIDGSNPLSRLSGFELIYTLLTLHHVKDLEDAFSDFATLLNPGGMLIIGDLISEDGSFHYRDPEFDGHKGFDPENLKKMLSENGFETGSARIFYSIEREYNNTVRNYPLFVLTGKKIKS